MITHMKLNSFTGLGYGQKATVTLAIGPTYEEITLRSNLDAALIRRVSITLNAEEIYVLSGDELKMLEAYKDQPAKAGFLTIPFSDITGKTKNGIRSTGLVTEYGDNITLEVEIGLPADMDSAPVISLEAWAAVSEPQPARIIVPKLKRQTMQATAAGENEFLNLVSGASIHVRRIHFISDKVRQLKVYRDQKKVFEADRPLADFTAQRHGFKWQTGHFHFDPILRGFYVEGLFPTAHASELKFTVDTSEPVGSLPLLVESLEVVRPELAI
jgi:hypothetical protein